MFSRCGPGPSWPPPDDATAASCDDASFNMIEKELFCETCHSDCSDSSDDCISSVLRYQAHILVDDVCTSNLMLIEKADIDAGHVSQACRHMCNVLFYQALCTLGK